MRHGLHAAWRRVADTFADVLAEMHSRRGRTTLLVIAVALSTGALITSVGLSRTAAAQVDADLAASTLDLVTITPSHSGAGPSAGTPSDDQGTAQVFPDDTDARLEAVTGVAAAGRSIDITGLSQAAIVRMDDPQATPASALTVLGADADYLRAASTRVTSAASWMLDGDDTVALLGRRAAAELSIPVTADPAGLAILIDGIRYDVVGFLDGGTTDVSGVVMIPYGRAVSAVGSDQSTKVLVRTDVGSGPVVAGVVRTAVRPDAPDILRSSQALDPAALRHGVATQFDRLAAWIGGLLLLLTVLLIASTMIVSVMSRTAEIGVRRAVGASRSSIAALFLSEGAIAGFIGGLSGAAVAVVAVVAVSMVNTWTPALDLRWAVAGPALGVLAGIVSSAYPAWRAAGVEPAQAVRSD